MTRPRQEQPRGQDVGRERQEGDAQAPRRRSADRRCRVPAEDLRALTEQILATLTVRHRRRGLALTSGARRAIETYRWPGNVRELINALERAVVLARGDAITAEDLPDQVLAPPGALHAPSIATVPGSLEDVERAHVQRVPAESATLEEAATSLGINPTTLWRKRKRWGLD